MRHLLIPAVLVALSFQPALTHRVSAQEYPVVEEFQGVDLMEHFINGAAVPGDTDLERNCRPSEEEKGSLLTTYSSGRGGTFTAISLNILFENGEKQGTINQYFQCIGLERFSEPEMFGCSSIKTLFRYLEMFQPNHPSPDRAKWSEMDQELYLQLYKLGRVIIMEDEDGYMRKMFGNRWILCKEFW